MKHRPLLVRQPQEGLLDLLQPDRIVLAGWKMGLRKFGGFGDAPLFSLEPPLTIDKRVMQDRKNPRAEIAASAKGRALFIGAHQGIVDEIFGGAFVTRKGSRVSPH